MSSNRLPGLSIAVSVALLVMPAFSTGVAAELPDYYIYEGQPLRLELDGSRLSLQLVGGNNSSAATALKRSSLGIVAEELLGRRDLTVVRFNADLPAAADVETRIQQALSMPEVAFASPVFYGRNNTWLSPTAHILVRMKNPADPDAESILKSYVPGAVIDQQIFAGLPGAFRLKSASRDGFAVLAEANNLALDPRIDWAEPDMAFSGRGELIPNDPEFSLCWGLRNTGQFGGTAEMDMDADSAWDISTGSSLVKVLVIDVGVQQDHPDINQLPGADFTGEGGGGGPVNGCDNHGTPVAGCISGRINNSLGGVGVAPGCVVISARPFVANLDCSGNWSANYGWTADALNWGLTQGARVSNNSNIYGGSSSAINAAYAATKAAGMVHFACAGNSAQAILAYPASVASVNAVSALASSGTLAGFSSYGPGLDFCAPGETIRTADRTSAGGWVSGDYVYASGTSFASPYAAGVAALVVSQNPSATPAEVEARLICAARDLGPAGYDQQYGHGLVNAYRSILATVGDADSDGIDNSCDNCPTIANNSQADADLDSVGDACDNCLNLSNPGQQNSDSDPLGDLCDNCPSVANPGQEDANNDGIGNACCCVGVTGNVDCDPGNGVDIADLSALIDNLYITFTPLCCPNEANCDGQPGTDIADLSALIDFLYITFTPVSPCL